MASATLERAMSVEVAQKLASIQHWSHWNDIITGCVKEYNVSYQAVEEALPEYQRFLCMIACSQVQLSMFSREVDMVWHSHILNTQRYQEFCSEHMGRFIHHVPILGKHRDCLKPEDTCNNKCTTRCDTCKQPIPSRMQASDCSTPECDEPLCQKFSDEKGNVEAAGPAVKSVKGYCACTPDDGGKKCSSDPDTSQGKARVALVIDPELSAADRFRMVYHNLFGENPPAIWDLPPEEVDGVAVLV